jgi:phage tail-like protein
MALTSAPRLGDRESVAELQVEITPDLVTMELVPPVVPRGLDRFGALWHRPQSRRTTTVTVSAADGQAHKIALAIESGDARWRPRWTRWAHVFRNASELEGGSALDDQDAVSEDGQRLVALIRPGETRTFSLELLPELDGDTSSGTYGFEIVATDATGALSYEVRRPAFLKLTHPRSRLLDGLPAMYAEEMERLWADADGESPFFERFLLGFEDAQVPLKRTLDHLDNLFGPFSAPSEFLLWLGAWMCVPIDENWSEMQRRSLIREAVQLYRWRGTKRGLSRYLQIYTGVLPEISDQPVKGMRLGPETRMGDASTMLGDVPAHTFVVTLAVPDPALLNEQVIHDIIAYEKPAHTAYALRIVRRTA